jgi:hypothetical protein
MTDLTYTVAGVSFHKGSFKVRFANDIMRTKILQKNQHTDIFMETLPRPMTKKEAVDHLLTLNMSNSNPSIAETLADAAKKYASKKSIIKEPELVE